jgi:MoxR-like ATPase
MEEPSQTDLSEMYHNTESIINSIVGEVGKVIVGQKDALEHLLISLLSNGHALIESYPGLGKTLMINTLSRAMDLSFNRIQCTPDLMPSDITGTMIVEEHAGEKRFRFERGPVFSNIVLADEINRASPKTQSAFLESMQEKQITAGNET